MTLRLARSFTRPLGICSPWPAQRGTLGFIWESAKHALAPALSRMKLTYWSAPECDGAGVYTFKRSMPPRSIVSQFLPRGEAVSVQLGTHIPGRGIREGVVPQQAQRRAIVAQQALQQGLQPWLGSAAREGRTP